MPAVFLDVSVLKLIKLSNLGSEVVHLLILKNLAGVLATPLSIIATKSYHGATLSAIWKTYNAHTIFVGFKFLFCTRILPACVVCKTKAMKKFISKTTL